MQQCNASTLSQVVSNDIVTWSAYNSRAYFEVLVWWLRMGTVATNHCMPKTRQ